MRPLLPAATLALALTGCGLPAARQAAPEPTPEAAATSTTPAASAEPTRSRAETAYIKALYAALDDELEKGDALNEDAYLEDGREACTQVEDEEPIRAVMAVHDAITTSESNRDIYAAALTRLCPKEKRVWRWASTGFGDGEYTVGKDIRPGTYRTMARPLLDCYWERSTAAGGIIANQLVTNAPRGATVTVRRGEGFTARDCGPWIPAR